MTSARELIRPWVFDRALPRWRQAGRDAVHGGFYEQLAFDGTPVVDSIKRFRVQARQIYVYSHAHLLGWQPNDGGASALEAARDGFAFMTRHYWRDDTGGFAFSARRDGELADRRVEAYEQAFALFACAWLWRASGDAAARQWAERIVDFMDDRLADRKYGGYHENLEHGLPRRQNPHMHLLEALLTMHVATADSGYLDRAHAIVALFRDHFFDARAGTLGEFFTADWQPAPDIAGRIVEPGHHYEWTWLLYRYALASGDDVADAAQALFNHAETHGTDHAAGAAAGLVFDSLLNDGTDLGSDKRLWVQTEAVKAQVARIEFADDTCARDRLDHLLEQMFAHYLLDNGVWRDHLRRNGEPFCTHAPASSFYHVFLALSEALQLMGGSRHGDTRGNIITNEAEGPPVQAAPPRYARRA